MKRKQQAKDPQSDLMHIQSLAKQAVGDASKLFPLCELLDLAKSEKANISFAAITSLDVVFSKYVELDFFEKSHNLSNDLKIQRSEFLNCLCAKLTCDDLRLQVTCLEKYLSLVKQTSEKRAEFQNNLFITLCETMINFDNEPIKISSELLDRFTSLLNSYDDLRFYFLKNAAKHLEKNDQRKKHPPKKRKYDSNSIAHWLKLISKLEPAKEDNITLFISLDSEQVPKKNSLVNDYKTYKKVFSEAWLKFLTLPMNQATYSLVLDILHDRIIPNLSEPVKLIDFLVDAYDSGGIISLQSLSGLFTLINEHNLNYPHFYEKFYSLFDRNLLHVSYISKFFKLADLFLRSTHLPNYLICAFIKRMGRLMLFSDPPGIIIILKLIFNLFKVHPGALILIHNPEAEETIINEDPSKSHALESSLWELEVLKKHYVPKISSLTQCFSGSFAKLPFVIDDDELLRCDYKSIIDSDLKSRKWKNIGDDEGSLELFALNSSQPVLFKDSLWIF